MGFFDRFRRKSAVREDATSAGFDFPKARCHHYTLAHLALRTAAFDNPLGYLGVLASPDARKFLAFLLGQVSEHCREQEPRPGFGADDLVIHKVRVGGYPCCIVEMPLPRAPVEAYFTAAVVLANLDDELPSSEPVQMRYFTLEKGVTLGGPPRTVLCEWNAEGTHSNYGSGPEPRVESFIQAMEGSLSRSQEG